MAFKIASLFNVALEDVFIYEAKNTMQTLVERFKNYFGFEFGFERFTERQSAIKFAEMRTHERRNHKSSQNICWLACWLIQPQRAHLLRTNGCQVDIKTNEHSLNPVNSGFSPQSKFVLELALQVVRLQGKKSIGTEHLLWGLVRLAETDNTTLALFQRYEIDLESINS